MDNMKTKYIAMGMGLAFLAVALWFGRVAWRAHRNLVTLHVRNAPLAEVLRKIERQTWETIQHNPSMEARVKLDVTDMPLPEVLNLLAEQAGARASTVYAVYNSKPALRRLESALQGRTSLDDAGWTNVSKGMPFMLAGAELKEKIREQLKAQGLEGKTDPELYAKRVAEAVERNSSSGQARRFTKDGKGIFVGPGSSRAFQYKKDGSTEAFEEDSFNPKRLVVESQSSAKLKDILPLVATPEAAAKAARKAHGRWTTLYALEKSPIGLSFGGLPRGQMMSWGTNGPPSSFPGVLTNRLNALGSNLEQAARRRKIEEFTKFTPEQRVQRARELRSLRPPDPPHVF